jgi:hypothetical protein
MRSKKVVLFIKIAIPIVIIGGCLGVERVLSVKVENFSSKIIVVSEDNSSLIAEDKPLEIVSKQSYGNVEGFSENLGFISDDEALVGIGISREDFYKKYPKEFDKENENDDKANDNANNDIYGNIYRLKLSTLERKPLSIETRNLYSDFVPNVNKINYVKDNNYSIYDLKKDSISVYKKASDMEGSENVGNWSKDGNYLISYDNGDLNLYNVKDNSSKKLKIKNDNLYISMIPSFYSEDGEEIYFIGGQHKNKDSRYERQGIYKINSSNGETEEMLVLPYRDTQGSDYSKESSIPFNDYCVLDGGKKIIINAIIEGEDGTYIYDVDNKKFYNVVPHIVKAKEGSYCSSIWVSPDKTKVIYMNMALENNKEQWNLYAAQINENSLTSKICIYKNINISGSLDKSIQWSGDSKKILFFNGNEEIEKNNFSFKDKNEVNIITFK